MTCCRKSSPLPVVLINRAVAVAQVNGPAAGLDALKMITVDSQVERYPFLHGAEGEFHRRLGHLDEAERSFNRAFDYARTEPERRFIQRKLTALQGLEIQTEAKAVRREPTS